MDRYANFKSFRTSHSTPSRVTTAASTYERFNGKSGQLSG